MQERVLIVDDHAGFRSMARRLLVAGEYDVVGEAADGTEAIHEVRTLRPDVVLLDIQLPDLDGFQVAQALAAQHEPSSALDEDPDPPIREDEIQARVTLTPLPPASPTRESNIVRRGGPVVTPT